MQKITIDNFNLKKVKFLKDGGLECVFTGSIDTGGLIKQISLDYSSTEKCHPDVDRIKEKLVNPLFVGSGRMDLLDTLKNLKHEIDESLEKKAIKVYQNRGSVTGVHWSGTGNLAGAIVSGKVKVPGGNIVAINTKRIVFASDTIGIEKATEELCEDLRIEVYEYVYNGKVAEPELPLEEETKHEVLDGKAKAYKK